MVKLVILYKKPDYIPDFEQNYSTNLALLEKLPGIIRRQANVVLGGPAGSSPYYRFLELYFEDFQALDVAMRSPEGVAAGQNLMQFAGNLVELIFVDVFEDDTPPQP
ncbi:MAG: EthD family reductase [Anaerolineae bacterium]|nr:EthD family reductase [Anaerolineae bacterium]